MTSHPKDLSPALIEAMGSLPKVCNHIHLPVQCGSDRLLKEMNRHYTVEKYLGLIDYARKKIPDVTFSSDIIVGFPGETEEDFQGTLDLIRKVEYMQLFTFIYSKRTGTPAALLPDETTHEEKTERMARLLAAQEEIAFKLTAQQVGKRQIALAEGPGRNPGTVNFRLRNNLVVEIPCGMEWAGREAMVLPTGARGAMLTGELAL